MLITRLNGSYWSCNKVVEGASGGSIGGWVVVVEVVAWPHSEADGKYVVGGYEVSPL